VALARRGIHPSQGATGKRGFGCRGENVPDGAHARSGADAPQIRAGCRLWERRLGRRSCHGSWPGMASIPGDSRDGGGRAAPGAAAEAQGAAPGTRSPIIGVVGAIRGSEASPVRGSAASAPTAAETEGQPMALAGGNPAAAGGVGGGVRPRGRRRPIPHRRQDAACPSAGRRPALPCAGTPCSAAHPASAVVPGSTAVAWERWHLAGTGMRGVSPRVMTSVVWLAGDRGRRPQAA
jgi:hypothetical protein